MKHWRHLCEWLLFPHFLQLSVSTFNYPMRISLQPLEGDPSNQTQNAIKFSRIKFNADINFIFLQFSWESHLVRKHHPKNSEVSNLDFGSSDLDHLSLAYNLPMSPNRERIKLKFLHFPSSPFTTPLDMVVKNDFDERMRIHHNRRG